MNHQERNFRVLTKAVPVGNTPYAVAVSPNGTQLYVANIGGTLSNTFVGALTAVTGVSR